MSTNHELRFNKFLVKARQKYGNKFEYVKDTYSTMTSHMTAICSQHGEFQITPHAHVYQTSTCTKCNPTSKAPWNINGFIKKAKEVHGAKYGYTEVEYKNVHKKVKINCSIHGTFEQSPATHVLEQHGCPECGNKRKGGHTILGQSPNHGGTLYLAILQNDMEKFIKIGITKHQTPKQRISHYKRSGYNVDVVEYVESTIREAFEKEQQIKLLFSNQRYTPTQKFDGYTECFNFSKSLLTTIEQEIRN